MGRVIIGRQTKAKLLREVGADGPTFVLDEANDVELTEDWVQRVIDEKVVDVELVALEQAGNRRRRIVRLFIDHPEGVTHELCARISSVVGEALDEQDVFDGPYVLEVSSPGLERPLTKAAHFQAQLGKKVYVKTQVPVEGKKVWQGTLVKADGEAIVVTESEREARIPLQEIASAHLVFEFG
jgi:ribosome maturation factor RimP